MEREKEQLYRMQADVLKALAHPLRLAIADYLRDGEQCVCDIAEHVDAERSNVSRHLSVMLNAGVLDRRKDGLRAMYRLQTPCVLNFFSCVTRVLEERLEVEQGALESR